MCTKSSFFAKFRPIHEIIMQKFGLIMRKSASASSRSFSITSNSDFGDQLVLKNAVRRKKISLSGFLVFTWFMHWNSYNNNAEIPMHKPCTAVIP